MSAEEIKVEGEAGSVAGARWAAMKKLEERFPDVDPDQVEFETLEEGDRVVVAATLGGSTPEEPEPAAEAEIDEVEEEAEPAERPAYVIEHAHASEAEAQSDEPRSVGTAAPQAKSDTAPSEKRESDEEEDSDDWRLELPELPEDPVDRVRTLVEVILDGLDLDGDVDVVESDDEIVATVSGEDVGLLIGKHGQTIDAVQLVCSQAAFRGMEDRKRVVVDAEGYRDRRNEALHRQADRAASEAVSDGEPIEMESMTAQERRVVHNYLKENPEVETHSEGDEPYRFIVVSPVDGVARGV